MLRRSCFFAIPILLSSACGDDGTEPTPSEPEWQVLLEDLPGGLLRVWGSSSTDVWAVGADGDGNGSLVYHFDGETLQKLDPGTTGDLWWVHRVGEDDVRLVGEDGLVLRYRDSTGTFTPLTATSTDSGTVFGVWGSASNDVWMVGGEPASGTSILWRDLGGGIVPLDDAPASTSSTTVFKVHGFDDGSVWMVGARGGTWFFDGTTWSEPETETTETLFTVHGPRSERVWAVGGSIDGLILGWDGQRWTDETPEGAGAVNGIWATSDEDAFAAGFNGSIWQRDASGWKAFAEDPPTFEDFHSIWVDETGAIWAVGGLLAADPPTQGVLVRYGTPLEL